MKQLLPLFLLACVLACGTPTKQEIPLTIIKGTINHSKDDIHPVGLLTSAIRNGIETPNYLVELDTNGQYKFEIPLKEPTEIRLQYGWFSKILYVQPTQNITFNKTISFDLENGKIVLAELDPNLDTIIGPNAVFSQQMNTYNQLFNDSFRVELNATLPYVIPREFKDHRAKITQRIRNFTKDFVEKHAKNNLTLANWVKNHSEYRIAMDYMKYAFKVYGFSQYSPDLKEGFGRHYFDFFEEFPVDNPSAIANLNYQNYLQFYRKYLMAELKQSTSYQDCMKLPSCNEFEMEIVHLGNVLTGKTKDLTLSQQADYHLIRNNDAFLKNGLSKYLKEISDSIIIKNLLARKEVLYGDRVFEFSKNASLIQTDASGKEILDNIIERNPTNNTLLYFWNTQREIAWFFERKAQLQDVWKKMDSLDIKLVLLAHHSTPNVWKEKIEELGLIGDLWHLTDEQFSFFKDYFLDNRKPHFNYDKIYDRENFLLLIDKNQDLNTIDDISFRESSFTWLNNLPWQFKSMMKKQRQAQIKVGAQ